MFKEMIITGRTALFGMAIAVLGVCGCTREQGATCISEPQSEFVRIFDGTSFEGWEGNMNVFRIEDRAIVGGHLDRNIPRNEFLCTETEYSDFELTLKFKLVGGGNGGIQLRSRRVPNHNEVRGYQADIGQTYWGCLYDESRRNTILARPDANALEKVLNRYGWNNYRIRCTGKRIELWVNEYKTVDYIESDEGIEQVGLIGLQIRTYFI